MLVAGGTGAIGRPLVAALEVAGHEPIAVGRSTKPVGFDALDGDAVERVVAQTRPDAIVNLLTAIPKALNYRRIQSEFELTNRLRREGTANLMAAAALHGVKRVVGQSIAFAYRPTGRDLWVEHDPLGTETGEIARALAVLEQQTLETPGVEGIVLRYGFIYGPGTAFAASDGTNAAAVRKRRFPVVGRGDSVWSFVHVDDAASATLAALERGAPGTYNVVDDEPAPMREWLPVYAEAVGAPAPLRVPKLLARLVAGRQASATLQGASNAKVKTALGWDPAWPSWREGFRQAAG